MMRALNTAATGMVAEQTKVDVIANNLANVNTTGFRRSRAEFQDLIYQTMRAPGGQTAGGQVLPTGLQLGEGTRLVATSQIHMQGAMQQTGGTLDVAIEGSGFFQVTKPDGTLAYTRSGNLKTDAEGKIITTDGFPIEPAITVPPDATNVTIAPDGTVSVTRPGQTAAQQVGQIQLANFANPAGLLAAGRSMFTPSDASGQPLVAKPGEEGLGTLSQGFLEGSNVEVVNEMIDLISSQRAYEVNQKVIQASDEMLQRVTQR